MHDDDTLVLGDPAVWGGKPNRLRRREIKSGAARYSVEVTSSPVIFNLDQKSIGRAVAAAMATTLQAKLRSIAATASANTIRARETAARAFARGEAWARKRYAGGRIGATPPNASDRAFNDSGRMANGIAVGATSDGSFRINVPANRLDESTTSGELGVRRIWNRLVQLVPEIKDPVKLFTDPGVQKALRDGLAGAIVVAEQRRTELTRALAQARVQAVRSILGLIAA